MRVFHVLIACRLLTTTLSAQTAEQDLQKVLNPLANAKQLYFENQYSFYDEGSKVPSDTLSGVFHRNGTQQYVRMGQLEVLEIGNFSVSADHEGRIVSTQNETSGSLNELIDVEKLQGLLETREAKVEYVPGWGSLKAVSLIDPEKPDDKVIIQYDGVSWIIKEASITTDDPFANPYIEKVGKVTIVVRYLNYTTDPKSFPYKMEQYVRKEGKSYIAVGRCKGYRII